jgi:hypothetical protein
MVPCVLLQGCSAHFCPAMVWGGGPQETDFVVCLYTPPGNLLGQYEQNVRRLGNLVISVTPHYATHAMCRRFTAEMHAAQLVSLVAVPLRPASGGAP